jgi:hypothetical protein
VNAGRRCQHEDAAGMKILLVEDSYIERHQIGGFLNDWGLEHVSVGSGTEAVKLLEAPILPTWQFSIGSCPVWTVSTFCGASENSVTETTSTL